MQTFLPYADFRKSASILDLKRLGKQRVECLQILTTNAFGPYQRAERTNDWRIWKSCPTQEYLDDHVKYEYRKTPWYNHPAVLMWRGYTDRLVEYGYAICDEWIRRGCTDSCRDKIRVILLADSGDGMGLTPSFIGNEAFHASHRSNLLRKDPTYYSQFGWTESKTLPYIWPV